jgi:FkbM family methyltransferase
MELALDIAARNHFKARIAAVLALAPRLPGPLVYADVGVLWGVDNPVLQFLRDNRYVRVIGFELDPGECERLQAAQPNDLYLPFGVGDVDGTRSFYMTAFSACSSFLEPDLDSFRGAPHVDLFRVVRTAELPMRRFDSVIREGTIPSIDFLKIDSQGFELNVLQGFGAELDKLLGVRLETQFRPMYKNQGLFHDIYDYLSARGFILRDLRLTYPTVFEVVELEAYFSRDPQTIGDRVVALKLWDLLHDIPPGRTVALRPDGRIDWITMTG